MAGERGGEGEAEAERRMRGGGPGKFAGVAKRGNLSLNQRDFEEIRAMGRGWVQGEAPGLAEGVKGGAKGNFELRAQYDILNVKYNVKFDLILFRRKCSLPAPGKGSERGEIPRYCPFISAFLPERKTN